MMSHIIDQDQSAVHAEFRIGLLDFMGAGVEITANEFTEGI
jgi:hypothetical protein